jgi:O-antigen/teichoic acid export membrane protein
MTITPGLRSILGNFSFLFGSQLLTTLIGAAYAVLLARLLGPELYGTLTYGYSWYLTFITLTYLGLDMVLAREVGRDPGQAPCLAGSTLALRAAAATCVAILSAVAGYVFEPDQTARPVLLILSMALLGRAIWLWCSSVFVAFEVTRRQLPIDLFFRPFELVIVIPTLWFLAPRSILAIAVIHTVLWWLQAAVGIFIVCRRVTRVDFTGLSGKALQLIGAGIPGAIYTLTVIWFLQAPIVLFRQIAGVGDTLGHFALSMQITGYLLTIPYLVGSVALPVLSRSAVRDDGKTRSAARAMLVAIPAVGAALSLLGTWLAPSLTSLVFGLEYLQAGRILGEAIWLLIPISLAIGLQQVLFSCRANLGLASIFSIVGIVAMVALYAPLTRAFSYHGALLATGIGMSIWAGGIALALVTAGILSRPPRDSLAGVAQGNLP